MSANAVTFSPVADVLDQVAELVARGPCVRAAALDEQGQSVAVMSPRATVWCPIGAAMRVTRDIADGGVLYMLAFEAMDDYARSQRATCLAVWADGTPHADVVAAIRELAAVERAASAERAGVGI